MKAGHLHSEESSSNNVQHHALAVKGKGYYTIVFTMNCLTSYIAIRMSMMRSEEVKNGAPISKLEKSIVNISLLPTCNSVLKRESDSSYHYSYYE